MILTIGTALLVLTACGNDTSSDRASDESAPVGTIDDAGGGQIQSDDTPAGDQLGSWANPVPESRTKMPGISAVSFQETNLCNEPSIVEHRRVFSRFGVQGFATDIFFEYWPAPGQREETVVTLACSNPTTIPSIYPLTNGPGSDGVSVACPESRPHARRDSAAVFFHSAQTPGRSAPNMTQAAGGFGTNIDGLWNFRFHNWNASTYVTPQMWTICT